MGARVWGLDPCSTRQYGVAVTRGVAGLAAPERRDSWISWISWIRRISLQPGLRLLSTMQDFDPDRRAAYWRGANREISARLVSAGVRERLCAGGLRGDALVADDLFDRDHGGPLSLPVRARRGFELHRIDLDRHGADLDPRLDDPGPLIDALSLRARCSPSARLRVRAEILDSARNLATARLACDLRWTLAQRLEAGSLPPELAGNLRADPRLEDPEHFVTDGHPWHPMTRTRLGLGLADGLRHAPELLAQARLASVEVRAELAQTTGAWDSLAPALGLAAPTGWVRLPVHPVQARRLPSLFPALWARGELRHAPPPTLDLHGGPSARPLLSMRTLALAAHPLHLKLALGVLTTSARRTVSPMSVHNGPEVSALIERIQARDPDTRALQLMAEPAAAGLDPSAPGLLAHGLGPLARELGVIVRAAPGLGHRGPGPLGASGRWVCAAIGERWPGREQSVLEHACAGYPGGRSQRVRALLQAWMEALVPPALRLLSAYGVALELHLQNTLVEIQAGRLIGLWVRDLGGIRIHAPRLRAAGLDLELAPDSFIITDDLDEVIGKLEHVLFHAHLSHLFEVAAALGVPEAESWARLRRLISRCLLGWAGDPTRPPRERDAARADLARLTQAKVRAKALLSMRLHERSSDYDYTQVDNALAL